MALLLQKKKNSKGADKAEEDISAQIGSSDKDGFFGGYEGTESLTGSRDAEGAVGFGSVSEFKSPEGSGTNSVRPNPVGLGFSPATQSQDGRNNTWRPRVHQPRRPLPSVPRYEDVGPRIGYHGERWPNDIRQSEVDDHGYHYATNTVGGARRKQLFHSTSTMQLEEKMADRMQLLNDVQNHTINNGGVNGANSLSSPGQSGSIVLLLMCYHLSIILFASFPAPSLQSWRTRF